MSETSRRNLLVAAGAAATGAIIDTVPAAAAKAVPKPIFEVPIPGIPIVAQAGLFPLRRIYCIGRNYAAHAIERGSDPTREPPFFFQKPTDAIQFVAPGTVVH